MDGGYFIYFNCLTSYFKFTAILCVYCSNVYQMSLQVLVVMTKVLVKFFLSTYFLPLSEAENYLHFHVVEREGDTIRNYCNHNFSITMPLGNYHSSRCSVFFEQQPEKNFAARI